MHTHLERWAADAAAPVEQLGVWCLAQGYHLSRGQFLPEQRFKNTTSGYKSNALSIRPWLPLWACKARNQIDVELNLWIETRPALHCFLSVTLRWTGTCTGTTLVNANPNFNIFFLWFMLRNTPDYIRIHISEWLSAKKHQVSSGY